MRIWFESTAGIEDAPVNVMPMLSAMPVMVLAVPIVMQVPLLRASPAPISIQSWSLILPALRSFQYFQESEPEPSTLPAQFPRSIGPAGM
ncbi:hypothetical protein D3C83_68060 [compost metagenome]